LKPGRKVRVENAPTIFGKVGFSIEAMEDGKRMLVRVDPPLRRPPGAVTIHLRHPKFERVVGVRIDGIESADFSGDTIFLGGIGAPSSIEVRFEGP
jgi:hypothetical protein